MKPEHLVVKGQQARATLENPVIAQAFEDVEKAIVTAWAGSPIRDVEGQHELKLMLKLLTDLRKNLDRAVEDGKLAAIQIEQERKPTLYETIKRKVM